MDSTNFIQGLNTKVLTVIFASFNGVQRLERTLESLLRQDLDSSRWEIIAVDNNSTDSTYELLQSYSDRLPITVLREDMPGKARSINRAIRHATGDLLVFTDDDIRAEPDWLSNIVDCARNNLSYGVFGGRILPEWEAAPPSSRLLDWVPVGSTFAVVEESTSGPCEATRVWGPNTIIRRSALGEDIRYREDIGPLPGGVFAMGEDTDIVMRLAKRGVKVYRCAEAVVHHWIPAANVEEGWMQRRAERLGYGIPAIHPAEVPSGLRLAGVPVRTWIQSLRWLATAGLLYFLPASKRRFWAIWKCYYMRGFRAGIRRYSS